jgi:diaminopimelate epimerase
MELYNADGSRAEMSGNGARCLGLAAAREGWWADRTQPLVLRTPAGERGLDWRGGDLRDGSIRVGMGEVTPIGDPSDWGSELGRGGPGGRWTGWPVTVGNPHAVALIEGAMPPLEELEDVLAKVEPGSPTDVNYEFVVRGPEVEALTMVVRERGAGWTQACGTGSVAAAWAAHQQGWVGRLVTVHNPGGAVEVDLSEPEARLTGPATFVATVDVPDEDGREGVPA